MLKKRHALKIAKLVKDIAAKRQNPLKQRVKRVVKTKKSFRPKRITNIAARNREYLSESEISQLQKAATQHSRHPLRDEAIILIMFRHALRVSELIALRWDQLDLKKGWLHVKRLKGGLPSTHPVRGTELRMLRRLQRKYIESPYVFMSEKKSPISARSVHHIVARAGKAANLPFSIHPHMLRHSTGFYLANRGEDTRAIQSYLGHASITNTVMYTSLSPQRFKNFWPD